MNEQVYEKELKSIRRQIVRSEEKTGLLKTERDILIRQAYGNSKLTMLAIATHSGITKGLVWQIIREYRKKTND